jgi:hypothetical protein
MYQNANNTRRGSQRGGARTRSQHYYVTHDFDGTATLSETVVHALSGAANVDVSKVEQTLGRQLDITALDKIFRPAGQPSTTQFGNLSLSVLGHDLTVYNDGQIVIAPQPGPR